jgi:hypothetical protein
LAAHSADVPAAGTARGSGWGRGARSSDMPRSPRGERRPLRPPIAWQEASLAGAARLAGRLAERPASENVCENVSEAAREAACAIARETACATALRGRVRQCVRSGVRYRMRYRTERRAGSHAGTHAISQRGPHAISHAVRVRDRSAPRGGSPRDSLTRCDSVSCHTFLEQGAHVTLVALIRYPYPVQLYLEPAFGTLRWRAPILPKFKFKFKFNCGL